MSTVFLLVLRARHEDRVLKLSKSPIGPDKLVHETGLVGLERLCSCRFTEMLPDWFLGRRRMSDGAPVPRGPALLMQRLKRPNVLLMKLDFVAASLDFGESHRVPFRGEKLAVVVARRR